MSPKCVLLIRKWIRKWIKHVDLCRKWIIIHYFVKSNENESKFRKSRKYLGHQSPPAPIPKNGNNLVCETRKIACPTSVSRMTRWTPKTRFIAWLWPNFTFKTGIRGDNLPPLKFRTGYASECELNQVLKSRIGRAWILLPGTARHQKPRFLVRSKIQILKKAFFILN